MVHGIHIHGAKIRSFQESCQVRHGRLPVGGSPGPRPPILEGVFPWPEGEDILVSRPCGGGHSEPGTQGVAPGTEPLETELGQLVSEGGRPEPCYGSHGHPLAPLRALGLSQGYTRVPNWTHHLQMGTSLTLPVLDQSPLVHA